MIMTKEELALVIIKYGPMVKRLRHRPFTAVTRVRISLGSFEHHVQDMPMWLNWQSQ